MRRLTTDDFEYSKGSFTKDVSELCPPGTILHEFEIQSINTGAIIQFALTDRKIDPDGDVMYWTYTSQGADQFGRQSAC